MNNRIIHLYNDGDNNGNVKIHCNDGILYCHSFVLKNQSTYFHKILSNPLKRQKLSESEHNRIYNLEYNHDSTVVSNVLNKMYNGDIDMNEMLTPYQLLDLRQFMHKIEFDEENSFWEESEDLLRDKLTEENWFGLMEEIVKNNIEDESRWIVASYFSNVILEKENILERNPFEKVSDMNSELGKFLMTLCLAKIRLNRNHENNMKKPISEMPIFGKTTKLFNQGN